MNNERPGEDTLWRSRLEEPGALPGVGLTDKEVAWDKLYDRLKEAEAPRRKRLIWLWAAAACLLLLVAPAALLLKERHLPARHPEKIPNTPMAASAPKSDPIHSKDLSPEKAPLIPKGLARSYPAASGHKRSAVPVHPSPLEKLLEPVRDTGTLTVIPRPDSARPLLATNTAPPKKEQRVVHINELAPSQPAQSMAAGQRYRSGRFHVGIVPNTDFRPTTTYTEPASGNAGHPILFLKHAQNP